MEGWRRDDLEHGGTREVLQHVVQVSQDAEPRRCPHASHMASFAASRDAFFTSQAVRDLLQHF